eukprot:1158370-Pelagomonas_calceolata.AAC.5
MNKEDGSKAENKQENSQNSPLGPSRTERPPRPAPPQHPQAAEFAIVWSGACQICTSHDIRLWNPMLCVNFQQAQGCEEGGSPQEIDPMCYARRNTTLLSLVTPCKDTRSETSPKHASISITVFVRYFSPRSLSYLKISLQPSSMRDTYLRA